MSATSIFNKLKIKKKLSHQSIEGQNELPTSRECLKKLEQIQKEIEEKKIKKLGYQSNYNFDEVVRIPRKQNYQNQSSGQKNREKSNIFQPKTVNEYSYLSGQIRKFEGQKDKSQNKINRSSQKKLVSKNELSNQQEQQFQKQQYQQQKQNSQESQQQEKIQRSQIFKSQVQSQQQIQPQIFQVEQQLKQCQEYLQQPQTQQQLQQVPQQIPQQGPQQQLPLQGPQSQLPQQQLPQQGPQSQLPQQGPQSQLPQQEPQLQVTFNITQNQIEQYLQEFKQLNIQLQKLDTLDLICQQLTNINNIYENSGINLPQSFITNQCASRSPPPKNEILNQMKKSSIINKFY